MINRVTNQGLAMSAQRNLQSTLQQLAKAQDTASSLKRIARPSDDPAGAADSMRVRSEQSAATQFARNIDDGNAWLTTVDTALSSASGIMAKVRDLTVQGANDGAMSVSQKEAIAIELEGLRAELLTTANTKYLGRTVFAGNSDAGVAFSADLEFTGTGSAVERRIGTDTAVRVDADGSAVFGVGGGSAFALVDSIVKDLRSGVNVSTRLTEIDGRLGSILGQQGAVGARQAQVIKAEAANVDKSVSLEAQRARIEDVDLGQAVLELKAQEVSYQAALAVTARALQPTLMDFLS
ncbi:MAG: flagellar hook-associated protein 3 [Microbacteriaceae bacterium]|nr:flagellar hook-associated protein 3 [Microbacteriaceae bacterium]